MHQSNHLVMVDLHSKIKPKSIRSKELIEDLLDEKQGDEKYFPRRDHSADHDGIDYHRERFHGYHLDDLSTRISKRMMKFPTEEISRSLPIHWID